MVSGRISACKYVQLACQRHLNDLAASKKRAYPYVFDPDRANRVCEFLEGLPHTKGEWASKLELIKLQPWQCFLFCVALGWAERASGLRRFRAVYIEVPRKNGKSIIGAGIGNYMLTLDGEFGAEVYSGATTEKQAWEVFRPAKQMVERTPDLKEAFGITVAAKSMFVAGNGSRFEPLIGKPGDGASPSCAIVDEYHEHDTNALVDAMLTGMGARRQPLLWIITTAGSNTAGPCYELRADVLKVLKGAIQRDNLFGLVYTVDEGDDWTTEAALRKANPNYDVSVFGSFLKSQQQQAIQSARLQNTFLTKHLNIWVGARSAWMNMQLWNALADESLRAEEFQGCPCFEAVDLSSTIDLTARVKTFRKLIDGKDHYYVFADHYIPEKQAQLPANQHYAGWINRGVLHATAGSAIDYEAVLADAKDDVQKFRVQQFAYDPWNAEHFAQKMTESTRTTMVKVPNQVAHLSPPMKQLEALVADGRIHHDGDPVLTWCISNVVAKVDAKDNIFPRKERDENKIDGAVALIMAMSRALLVTDDGYTRPHVSVA